ncbi:unnamed protein product [Triticum turgidum subsp. durum]|uniref:B-block binding subunit of TFIIIC domain-containing protein n=1 Tax=Triticum turgidum subsp. durum TaxID=4567 RepID=A0A9R0QH14_TRITD|nr:unnamed protein product [Triticum turgidum subsp. durum]
MEGEEGALVPSPEKDVEAAERRGARLVASPALGDNFLGIYDHRCSSSKLSDNQRKTLEHVAASRTPGVAQRTLSKRFHIEPNKFYFVVKTLQSQGLIAGKQAIVKSNGIGGESEDDSGKSLVGSTNLLYLSRYAKGLNMNSHQRTEITNVDALQEDETLGVDHKSHVSIHDHLPAMKAICDKLEEASGKVLAISDIKKDLGYSKPRGHRAWRNVVTVDWLRAQWLERNCASQLAQVVGCLRLLKKFSPDEFKPKSTALNYKLGMKCLATDQLMELPLDNCIYDMIHAQGPKGATLVEVSPVCPWFLLLFIKKTNLPVSHEEVVNPIELICLLYLAWSRAEQADLVPEQGLPRQLRELVPGVGVGPHHGMQQSKRKFLSIVSQRLFFKGWGLNDGHSTPGLPRLPCPI